MAKDKVKVTIYLPDDVHHRLKLRAVQQRSSMSDLAMEAIERLLAQPAAAETGPAAVPSGVDAEAR